MLNLVAIAIASFMVSGIAAQTTLTATMSGFDSSKVDSKTKNTWCQAEYNACPKVCSGSADVNTCESDTLTYVCECGNGTQPDLSPYMNTLPFFVCEETFAQCMTNNPTDVDAQDQCKAAHTCGSIDPLAASTSSTSATASTAAATTTRAEASGSASQSAATATSTGAAMNMVNNEPVGLLGALAIGALGFLI